MYIENDLNDNFYFIFIHIHIINIIFRYKGKKDIYIQILNYIKL